MTGAPRWLKAAVIFEVVAIGAAGSFMLFLVHAFSGPLPLQRWLAVGAIWLVVPLALAALMIAGGRKLIDRGQVAAGTAVSLLPLLLLALVILWANL